MIVSQQRTARRRSPDLADWLDRSSPLLSTAGRFWEAFGQSGVRGRETLAQLRHLFVICCLGFVFSSATNRT